MTKPIQIFHGDDEKQVRERHEQIIKRLVELGPEQVRGMAGNGLPSQWDPIIRAWLKGDALEPAGKPAEAASAAPAPPPLPPPEIAAEEQAEAAEATKPPEPGEA